MPAVTYIEGNSNSNFLTSTPATTVAKKFLETSAPGNATVSWSASASTNYYAYYNSRSTSPGNPAWPSGNYSVELNITTALARSKARCQLHRYDNDGALVESSGWTALQNTDSTGVKTFNFTSLDLGTTAPEHSLDRLVVEFEFQIGATAGTIAFDIGDTNAEVVTPIIEGHVLRPEVAAAPVVAAAPTSDRPLSVAPTPGVAPVVGPAPALTMGTLSLAQAVAAAVAQTALPTLSLPVSLAQAIAAAQAAAAAPTLTLPVSLLPTPAAAPVVAPGQQLDLPRQLAPTPAIALAAARAPTRSSPLDLAPTPSAATPSAAPAARDAPLSVAGQPAVVVVVAPEPAVTIGGGGPPPIDLFPTPAGVAVVAPPLGGLGDHLTYELVARICRGRLAEILDGQAGVELWPNAPEVPQAGAYALLGVQVGFEGARLLEWGESPWAIDRKDGVALVIVMVPLAVGSALGWELAQSVAAGLRARTDGPVRWREAWPTRVGTSGGWDRFDVVCPFEADGP